MLRMALFCSHLIAVLLLQCARWRLAILGLFLCCLALLINSVTYAIDMPPTVVFKVTDEGWRASAMTLHEQITPIDNIASSKDSYEAFVNLDARAAITGKGNIALKKSTANCGLSNRL